MGNIIATLAFLGVTPELLKNYRMHCRDRWLAGYKPQMLSENRPGLRQYVDLPELVAEPSREVGRVEQWIMDAYGQKNGKPLAKALQKCSSFAGPVKWGWGETSMYSESSPACGLAEGKL